MHRSAVVAALALALAAPPAALADGSAENERLRVTMVAPATVVRGTAFEFVLDVENLTNQQLKVRSRAGMLTPFGRLYGPVPSPRKLEPRSGVEVAALMLCEEGTPLGTYEMFVEVTTGRLTLTIPHTITVVEG